MSSNTAIKSPLYRTVVLLFWLADLADRCASLSPEIRRIVLYILRNGEFAALALLFDLTKPGTVPSFDAYWDDVVSDEPEDAILLAARLRLFAFAVAQMAMLPEEPVGLPVFIRCSRVCPVPGPRLQVTSGAEASGGHPDFFDSS